MLDMSKEIHRDGEPEDIIRRFGEMDLEKLYAVCHEHELDGVVGSYALSLGLTLPDDWNKEYERQQKHLTFLREKAKEICASMDENGNQMILNGFDIKKALEL